MLLKPYSFLDRITLDGEVFEFTVETTNTSGGSTASDHFKLPLKSNGSYGFLVDWGDGNIDYIHTYNQAEVDHTYSVAGEYTVQIRGTIVGFEFNTIGDKLKILDISSWGTVTFNDGPAFYGCTNLTVSATDAPTFVSSPANVNMTSMFRGCASLTTMDVSSWDVSEVELFSNTFRDSGLTSLDASAWDTSGATSFSFMFFDCTSLTSVILSVGGPATINLGGMFSGCTALTTLDVSAWDTSTVITVGTTFFNCSGLTDLRVDLWDWTSITSATDMFNGVTLTTARYSALLIAVEAQLVNNSVSFHGGNSLYDGETQAAVARQLLIDDHSWTITDGGITNAFEIDITSDTDNTFALPLKGGGTYNFAVDWGDGNVEIITVWNQSEVDHTYASASTSYTIKIGGTLIAWAFNDGGDKLLVDDLVNWGPFEQPSGQIGAFYGCSNMELSATDAPKSLTGVVSWFFTNCSSITELDVTAWDFSAVTKLDSAFSGLTGLTTTAVNFTGVDFSSLTDMSRIFLQSTPITAITGINGWDVSSVQWLYCCFGGLSNLASLDISSWDVTSACISMYSLFWDCTSLTSLTMSASWDTSNISDMSFTFGNCTSLSSIDVTGWDTSSVTNMKQMFYNTNVTDVRADLFDVTSLTNAISMFAGVTLTTTRYDALLVAWEAQAVQDSVQFHGGNSQYTDPGSAADARAALIADHSWSITDGGPV